MTVAGKSELRSGDFEAAETALRARIAADAADAGAWLCLSAVLRRTGRRREARRALIHFAKLRPIEFVAGQSDAPAILRPRCIDSANYCAVRRPAGHFETKFKGGHFSLNNLLPRHAHSMLTANVVGGDPAPLFAAPEAGLLLNPVACADRARASLSAIARFLETRPEMPVINHPDAVARTTRDGNFERLGTIDGAIFPVTIRLPANISAEIALARIDEAGLSPPLLVRTTGRHTGRELRFCETREDVVAALAAFGSRELYAIAYHDLRGGDGLFRKARAFFIDGAIYPVAWLTSDEWQIHSGDRYRVMATSPGAQAEEQAYLEDPGAACGARAWAALREVGERLALDFAGIDFAIAPGGELFIFEANAAMRHNFDHTPTFPYTRPYLERISAAFDAMVQDRLDDPGDAWVEKSLQAASG